MIHWLAKQTYRHPVPKKLARQPYKLVRCGTPLCILLGYGRGRHFCYEKNAGYVLGFYEYDTQRALSQFLTPGAAFFDVGANQ